VQRQQTKVVVFGIAVTIALVVLAQLLSLAGLSRPSGGTGVAVVDDVVLTIVPICIAVATLRFRLFDVDVVINRTLVYGLITAGIIAFYVLAVGLVAHLVGSGSRDAVALAATGIVAVAVAPVRAAVQQQVNRLMYGRRDEPYAVLADIGRRLEHSAAAEASLDEVTSAITEALRLPYAAIIDGGGRLVAASGPDRDFAHVSFPLVHQRSVVGELRVGPRAAGDTLTAHDRRLLADVARQAAVAVHALDLTTNLRRSREALVTAREEERRRIRRDLHDGLGPSLAGLNLQLASLLPLIADAPSRAQDIAGEVRADVRKLIVDVRRIVNDLRPPALDELGLAGSLQALASAYRNALDVHVDTGDLGDLPAAVEVAALRIVTEAMTNTVRHASAGTCGVQVRRDSGELRIRVSDDGRGIDSSTAPGVGLNSMRERATELGGTFDVETGPAGTTVTAALPLGDLP
jgi:signal transduction histidine kinase